jgi:BlaI family transcriptional regulator, penicillinase repressor
MKALTKAEEQIMQVLWKLKEAFLKDVVENMPEPKPHVNTIATVLKILHEKGFVNIESFSRIHRYSPAITKEAYSNQSMSTLVKNYFSGSYKNAVSFLVEEDKISIDDLQLLLDQLKKK